MRYKIGTTKVTNHLEKFLKNTLKYFFLFLDLNQINELCFNTGRQFFLTSAATNQCHFSAVVHIQHRSALTVKSSSSTVTQSKIHHRRRSIVFSLGWREGDDGCRPLKFSFCPEFERASLYVRRRVRKLRPKIFSRFRTVGNRLAVWHVQALPRSQQIRLRLWTWIKLSWRARSRIRNELCFVVHGDFVTFWSQNQGSLRRLSSFTF